MKRNDCQFARATQRTVLNYPHKKSSETRAVRQLSGQRTNSAHRFKPAVAQLKSAVSEQSAKQPVAPPVYRPLSKHLVAQAKMAGTAQMKAHQVAPPVYRPQPVPRVLQTKSNANQPPVQRHPGQKPVVPSALRPVARKLDKPKDLSHRQPVSTNKPVLNSVRAVQRQSQKYRAESNFPSRIVQMSSAAAKPAQATTNVTLYIGDDEFAGKASGQYGHAEMDALWKFLSQYASAKEAAEALKAASKSVSCIRIPVCVSCSLVLQALGFAAHEAETEFSEEQSGGVAWNGNLKLKGFMEHLGLGGVYATALEKGKK